MGDLSDRLRQSVLELAEANSVTDSENLFDPQQPLQERVFALELALTDYTKELANMAGLVATLTLKLAEFMGLDGE